MGELIGLFTASFLAATLLPTASEAVLIALFLQEKHPAYALWLAATLGNTLGAASTMALGWYAHSKMSPKLSDTAIQRLRRYGPSALLLSWLPIVGDPLCLAAGWLRLPLVSSLFYICIGKAARYVFVMLGAYPFINS